MEVIASLPPIHLLPLNQTEILEHSRRICSKGASHLSAVFDNLLYAERELTILQRSRIKNAEVLGKHTSRANDVLKFAFVGIAGRATGISNSSAIGRLVEC